MFSFIRSFTKKNLFLLLIVSCFIVLNSYGELSREAREKGFVYLREVDPTILISPRYATPENFIGRPLPGYEIADIVLTRQAATALQKVQKDVNDDGYCLVVYDAYRPQKTVDLFMLWSRDFSDQLKKSYYYPRVAKERVFELGYVAEHSGHSRGSTVDLTLIKTGDHPHPVIATERHFGEFSFKFLDDGTVDMGSSFDLFDLASHLENDIVPMKYKELRTYLKDVMARNGFRRIVEEWWHFTLNGEPYPETYFNFDIE